MKRMNCFNLTYNPFFWYLLLGFSIFFAGGLVWKYSFLILENWIDIIKYIILLMSILVSLHSKLQRFYLFLARIKAVILNVPVSCNLNVDYTFDNHTTSSIPVIKATLMSMGKNKTILSEKSNELVLKIDGIDFFIRSEFVPNEELWGPNQIENLNIQILEYHAPYSLTIEILTAKLLPFLEEIEQNLSPSKSSYLFEAIFTANHPFLGLFAQRIPFSDLTSFDMEYFSKEKTSTKKSIVRITKRGISVQTSKLTSLSNLVYKHLAASGG